MFTTLTRYHAVERASSGAIVPHERDDSSTATARWRPVLAAALLAVMTTGLLRPLVNETRIWDDDRAIFANPALLPPSTAALRRAWLSANQSQYNPVTHTLWWAVAHAAYAHGLDGPQLDARVFHLANLLVHVSSVLVVFALLRKLARADWPAWGGATLFAVHPVQVETVAWIFGMRDLLCGLLCLVTIDRYVAAVTRPGGGRVHYILALLAFALAVLSKAAAVVLPGMLVAVDLLVLRRPPRAVLRAVVPFALLALPCVAWMPFVQPAPGADTVRRALRPLVAADALAFYLWKLVWPFDLVVDYGRTPGYALSRGWLWWTWLAPAAVAIVLLALRRRAPLVVAGAALFVIGLLTVLGLKRFDFQGFSTVADHYLYLPMFGVALAFASLLRKPSPAGRILALVLLAALAWRARDQTRAWASPTVFWNHVARVNPRSWSAHYNLAVLALRANRPADAEALARRAIEVGGDYFTVHELLGNALERQGRTPEALEQFRWTVTNRPDLARGYVTLANAYVRAGRPYDALALLRGAHPRHGSDPQLRRLLDELHDRHRPP